MFTQIFRENLFTDDTNLYLEITCLYWTKQHDWKANYMGSDKNME